VVPTLRVAATTRWRGLSDDALVLAFIRCRTHAGTWKPYADTTGGDLLRLHGRNFGPRGVAQPHVRYGAGDAFDSRWYAAAGCEVKGHATLECTRLAEGVGAALRVRVGGIGPRGCSVAQCQTSRIVASEAALLSYAAPRIYTLEGAGGAALVDSSTAGGGEVVVRGRFFGPAGGVVEVRRSTCHFTPHRVLLRSLTTPPRIVRSHTGTSRGRSRRASAPSSPSPPTTTPRRSAAA